MTYIDYWIRDIKREEKDEVKICKSYTYWINKLLEKCVRIFEWNGLPFPQREIEMNLILYGICGFVNDGERGLMVAKGSMSGPTQYPDIFKNFTYAAPTAQGGTFNIGKECVVIYNNALYYPLIDLITRTASLLAHAEISIKCSLVNMRSNSALTASDDSTVENLKAWYNKLYEGELTAISVDDTATMIGSETVSNPLKQVTTNLTPLQAIEARNEILRMFYSELGIRFSKEKRGNMTDDEVNTDSQMLMENISDMLFYRKQACGEINKLFGLDVSVKLNENYSYIVKGEYDNDN
jgi:hypothetical protein